MKKIFDKQFIKCIENEMKERPFNIDAETYLWRTIRADIICNFEIPMYYGVDKEIMKKLINEDVLLFEQLYKHFLKRIKNLNK